MVEAAPLSLPVEMPPVAAPPVAVAIDSVVTDGAADLRHTNAFHSGICGNVCPSPEFSEGACCLTCWCMPFTFARIRRVEFGDNYWTSFWMLASLLLLGLPVMAYQHTSGYRHAAREYRQDERNEVEHGRSPFSAHMPANMKDPQMFLLPVHLGVLVLLAALRTRFKKKYNIKNVCCDSCLCEAVTCEAVTCEDCCCAMYCHACILCQMAHHSDRAHNLRSGCDCGPTSGRAAVSIQPLAHDDYGAVRTD